MEQEVGLLIKDITFKVKRYDLKNLIISLIIIMGAVKMPLSECLGTTFIFQTQAIHYLLKQYRLRADKTDHAIF